MKICIGGRLPWRWTDILVASAQRLIFSRIEQELQLLPLQSVNIGPAFD